MIGRILWIDDRTKQYEGQLLGDDGLKYYFNYSTCNVKPYKDKKPMKGQLLRFETEVTNHCRSALNVRDFLDK